MRLTGPPPNRTGAHLIALALAALAVAVPIVDFAEWSLWRQQLQLQADGAALAYAERLRQGRAMAGKGQERLYRQADAVRVEHPPRSGAYPGRANVVRVLVQARHAPLLTGFAIGPLDAHVVSSTGYLPTDRPGETRLVRLE